jgi:beta-lactam-binding protein with PASTA domain
MLVADAAAALRSAGFSVQIDPTAVFSPQYAAGMVADMSPGPGSSAQPGDTVTLIVSKGTNTQVRPSPGPNPSKSPKH